MVIEALAQFDLTWPDVSELVEFMLQIDIMTNFTFVCGDYKRWPNIELSQDTDRLVKGLSGFFEKDPSGLQSDLLM